MAAKSIYTNESKLIHLGPCDVLGVQLAGDDANADCQVYDGENTNGELKVHLEALSGTSFHWSLGDGVDFDHGIYVVVNANTAKVTVIFKPKSKKSLQ